VVASDVRSENTLRRAVGLLHDKWEDRLGSEEDSVYEYVCEQFKSVRQDVVVQRIVNQFTVQVYEMHARIALEYGDMPEFLQCATQLVTLHQEINPWYLTAGSPLSPSLPAPSPLSLSLFLAAALSLAASHRHHVPHPTGKTTAPPRNSPLTASCTL
jgi:hypothetical protein